MKECMADYLLGTLPKKEEWVLQMEEYADNERVPIMDPISMNFMMQLIRVKRPDHILEIGTAIGYSALMMAQALPDAKIISIEKDEARYQIAMDNINKQGKKNQIQVIHGDARHELEILRDKGESFDLIFIDAAKGQYRSFFELAEGLLKANAIIVSDNVLFRGLVAEPEKATRRHRKMVEKIRSYNKWISAHPEFDTSIIPVGDGIAISVKK
ncbi:O-methyltransferase [Virgibacillus sediminis]|uniref:tRNA 5-hydroxyuridine methyltransferase n=1 Tax=Virgibacillus sediminis TaxID=202260 RepID=A0ABV7A6A3_9BACI